MFILNEVLVRSQKQMNVMNPPSISRDGGAGVGLKVRFQGNECRVNKM